jgi:hypothetical protein
MSCIVGIYDVTGGREGASLVHSVTISIPPNTASAAWIDYPTTYSLLSTKTYAYAYVSAVNAAWELSSQSTSSMMEFHATANTYTMPSSWSIGSSSSLDALIEIVTGATIDSINGGAAITAGKTGVTSVSTGFTGLPATITTNASGVTCSSIGGTTNAATFNISDRVDGGLYPKSGTSVTFTFTNGSEVAAAAQTIVKKSTETLVAISSPLFLDNTLAQAILDQTGRTIATGDEFYHTVYSDLVITADTDFTVTDAGSFDLWVYVSSGADTGKNYYYSVTITESGTVVITSGLTTAGLTNSGLTSAGLTRAGL